MRRSLLLPLLVLAFALSSHASADCIPAKPAGQDHLVFQYTAWLSADEQRALDQKLVRFAQETSNRIAVVIVDDLCGESPGNFAFELGQRWGIGKEGWDNGVVVLVKPTGGPNERKVFIATGYGLEEKIPDAVCRRVVDNEIIPRFKSGDAFGGLDKGTDVLMDLAKGAYNAESYGHAGSSVVPFIVIGCVFLLIIGVIIMLNRNYVKRYAHRNGIDFWTAFWLMNQASRSHRGTWGGFTGGGGGGWGGGGGGFGGFGGGGFGGGGAGGSW